MNAGFVKRATLLAIAIATSGCAMQPQQAQVGSLISAAQFDNMITVEVKEFEPISVEDAVAAN